MFVGRGLVLWSLPSPLNRELFPCAEFSTQPQLIWDLVRVSWRVFPRLIESGQFSCRLLFHFFQALSFENWSASMRDNSLTLSSSEGFTIEECVCRRIGSYDTSWMSVEIQKSEAHVVNIREAMLISYSCTIIFCVNGWLLDSAKIV